MPIDRNKEWTQDECKALVMEIANRYGLKGVKFDVVERKHSACFYVRQVKRTKQISSVGIRMANRLWTGQYKGSSTWRTGLPTSPVDRLLITLHECAHMVVFATNPDAFWTSGHGILFQRVERQLLKEYGYSPVYVRTPGYAIHFVDINNGSKVCITS